jgi:hypothetical protein
MIVAIMAVVIGVMVIVMMGIMMKAMTMLILKGGLYFYKFCNGSLTNIV